MFNETGLINETSNRFDVIPYKDLSPESTWERLGKGELLSLVLYRVNYNLTLYRIFRLRLQVSLTWPALR